MAACAAGAENEKRRAGMPARLSIVHANRPVWRGRAVSGAYFVAYFVV
ncbi:hypothetical protein BURMUCGD2M_1076 [Burkholderia multivorans CGD2M]|uniref:Uncharacterized protein n=1 Tax=Burkholderia multivorans CGD2 TaxID=513052 RepID=B9BR32_9BURK|nr:hypothetical protein BURMUCGD2_0985 [Burkholderia multivorans CGD2]EEE12979.1 hypothetical protein BURMUCGD2M_1076 [Burkholderia multivorans CGD2M]